MERGVTYLSDERERRQAEARLVLVKLLKVMVENDGQLSGRYVYIYELAYIIPDANTHPARRLTRQYAQRSFRIWQMKSTGPAHSAPYPPQRTSHWVHSRVPRHSRKMFSLKARHVHRLSRASRTLLCVAIVKLLSRRH